MRLKDCDATAFPRIEPGTPPRTLTASATRLPTVRAPWPMMMGWARMSPSALPSSSRLRSWQTPSGRSQEPPCRSRRTQSLVAVRLWPVCRLSPCDLPFARDTKSRGISRGAAGLPSCRHAEPTSTITPDLAAGAQASRLAMAKLFEHALSASGADSVGTLDSSLGRKRIQRQTASLCAVRQMRKQGRFSGRGRQRSSVPPSHT